MVKHINISFSANKLTDLQNKTKPNRITRYWQTTYGDLFSFLLPWNTNEKP